MSRFRKLAEEVVFTGTLVTATRATFADPSGGTFERDVVHHPGAVVVVPVLDDGRVLLVRQFRAAIAADLLELPAGKRDVDGEPVDTTAHRELAEEVGMAAGRMELLAEFYNSPGFCDEHSFLFLARDLTPCAVSAQGIEEEHMTIETVSLSDVPAMIADRRLVDAKSIIGLCLAREVLGTR
ncbi:MAG: 8-oxo-dGDP phosphatase [Actinomycetota bacterium]|nr:8-oxo-dGDP phosphatase [Actinomycetota bacterium]